MNLTETRGERQFLHLLAGRVGQATDFHLIAEGKPEEMYDRIAQGKLAKFYKESTLLNQEYIKDNKMSIRQYLESVDKQLKVTAFKRYNLNQ